LREAKEVRQVKVKFTIAFWQAISTKKHSSVTTINLLREERQENEDIQEETSVNESMN
jgi:hypothetical protein